MLLAALLGFSLSCESGAQNQEKKEKGQDCASNDDCKSAVCTNNQCAQGIKKQYEEIDQYDEECESNATCPNMTGGVDNARCCLPVNGTCDCTIKR